MLFPSFKLYLFLISSELIKFIMHDNDPINALFKFFC